MLILTDELKRVFLGLVFPSCFLGESFSAHEIHLLSLNVN